MQAANSLWAFFALTFGVIVLPGLDMAFVAGSALTAGLRGGLAAVAGIVAGGLVHVLVNATGVSALLMVWPSAFNFLLLGGSVYMAWIGLGILRTPSMANSLPVEPATPAPGGTPGKPRSTASIFAKAALNCLLNPKAYVFMLAVFPAFLHSPNRSVAEQALLLAAIISANQIVVYGLIALSAARAHRLAEPAAGAQRWVSRCVGATLMVAAVFTLGGAWQPVHARTFQSANANQ